MDNNDLWPDFEDVPKITSPRTILTEQANILADKTKNLLTAQVKSGTSSDGKIILYFAIVAPLLSNYSYRLFHLYHKVFYYPCDIVFDNKIIAGIQDENDLKEKLKSIFASTTTKNILTSLIGQSKEASDS